MTQSLAVEQRDSAGHVRDGEGVAVHRGVAPTDGGGRDVQPRSQQVHRVVAHGEGHLVQLAIAGHHDVVRVRAGAREVGHHIDVRTIVRAAGHQQHARRAELIEDRLPETAVHASDPPGCGQGHDQPPLRTVALVEQFALVQAELELLEDIAQGVHRGGAHQVHVPVHAAHTFAVVAHGAHHTGHLGAVLIARRRVEDHVVQQVGMTAIHTAVDDAHRDALAGGRGAAGAGVPNGLHVHVRQVPLAAVLRVVRLCTVLYVVVRLGGLHTGQLLQQCL